MTVATGAAPVWTSVAYGDGHYVAVDAAGEIARSSITGRCDDAIPSSPNRCRATCTMARCGPIWIRRFPAEGHPLRDIALR